MTQPDPSVVAGYRIGRKLGEGGMGAVYAAAHPRLGREDAIKVLAPAFSNDPVFRARFQREAQLAARMEHPHIVPVYDCGEDQGRLWISMRLVEGPTAAVVLQKAHGQLPPAQVIDICMPVARALDFAHQQQLLHRDVKPENILIDMRATPPHVLLTDFGIARVIGDTGLTATGSVIGTADYSAPEHLRGERTDGRADQYSLACTAAYLLTGVKPFAAAEPSVYAVIAKQLSGELPTVSQQRPGLPTQVDAVFWRALAAKPADRYGSCVEFVTALQQALTAPASSTQAGIATQLRGTRPVTAMAPGAGYAAPATQLAGQGPHSGVAHQSTSRRPWPIIAAAVAAVVIVGGIAAFALTGNDKTPTSPAGAASSSTALVPGGENPTAGGGAGTAPDASADPNNPAASADPTGPAAKSSAAARTPAQRQYDVVSTARGAIDPCDIPSDLIEEGGMQAPLTPRTTPADQAIICGGGLATAGNLDVLIGGYVLGSSWERSMLANYDRGKPAAGLRDWRSYNMTERDGSIWCKYGYVSSGERPYALEIATVRVPAGGDSDGAQATRDSACTKLRAVAVAIDPAMPRG